MLRLPEILTYLSHFSSPGNTWLLGKFPEDCAFEWRASVQGPCFSCWPLLDGQLSPLGHWAWTLSLLYLLPKWLQWTARWFVFGILKAQWYLPCYLSPILAPIVLPFWISPVFGSRPVWEGLPLRLALGSFRLLVEHFLADLLPS